VGNLSIVLDTVISDRGGTKAPTVMDLRLQVWRWDPSRPNDLEEDLGSIDGAGSRD
jgi:hypothetical protein